MRLTADIILRAKSHLNPIHERELDLRGFKIPAIENLGASKDSYGCLDLSDNEIMKLGNFPRLKRLRVLLLSNNHVSRIQESLHESIGGLEMLILSGNKISMLSEIDRLACLPNLHTLSLLGNPVTKRKFYREYVMLKLPQLSILDFCKIKPKHREEAERLFKSLAGKKIEEDAQQEAAANTFDPGMGISAVNAMEIDGTGTTLNGKLIGQEESLDKIDRIERKLTNAGLQPERSPVDIPMATGGRADISMENAVPATTRNEIECDESAMDIEELEEPRAKVQRQSPSRVPRDKDHSPHSEELPSTSPSKLPKAMSPKKIETTPAAVRLDGSTFPADLSKMKVTELKEELKARAMPIGGLKSELVSRLQEALQ